MKESGYKGAEALGRGIGYKYAHDYPNHYVEQQYLPDALAGQYFYEPTNMGYEKTMKEYMEKIKNQQIV